MILRSWDANEWYPVYSLHEAMDHGAHVEITEEFAARYDAAYAEWTAVQDALSALAVFHPTPNGGRRYPLHPEWNGDDATA